MKPESYTETKRCSNCKFVFVREEWGQETRYYCHHDKSERPICMSIKMHELSNDDDSSIKRAWSAWGAWAMIHSVASDARCNEHEEEKE
jgi:hypothetical protein